MTGTLIGLGILAVLVMSAMIFMLLADELPEFLEKRRSHKLELEKEKTRRAELELEKYKLDQNIIENFKPKADGDGR